jgi:hypothetical protein
MEWKKWVRPLIVGVSVVLVTPMLAGLVDGIALLDTELFAGMTIGIILAAGVVAGVAQYVVDEYVR